MSNKHKMDIKRTRVVVILGYAILQLPDFLIYLRHLFEEWFETIKIKFAIRRSSSIEMVEDLA